MAPTDSSLVDQLKATVDKLEARIQDLESRLVGNSSSGSATSDGMRMILIGPPGAGAYRIIPGCRALSTGPSKRTVTDLYVVGQ